MNAGRCGHREIDHTADLGFEVWAESPSALFSEAVKGLGSLCYEREEVRRKQERSISVRGGSPEELLVRWLQEVYLQLEFDGWLAAAADQVAVGESEASGVLHGEPYDPQRHTLHTEIKAVTYHGLQLVRRADGVWTATVIVDV